MRTNATSIPAVIGTNTFEARLTGLRRAEVVANNRENELPQLVINGEEYPITSNVTGDTQITPNDATITISASDGLRVTDNVTTYSDSGSVVTAGDGSFTLNQAADDHFRLAVDPNDGVYANIPAILDNRIAIEEIRNNGHLNHIHSSTPFTRVVYPNPSATDERRWENAASGTLFNDLSWVNSAVAPNSNKVSRACFWLSSLPDDVNAGGANWYRHLNLEINGAFIGQPTRDFSIPANTSRIDRSNGLYERLELLTTWEQSRQRAIQGASRSWQANGTGIHTQFTAAAAYNGWNVGLSNDDLSRIAIRTNEVSPWDSRFRLAYVEAVLVFANDANDANNRAIGRETAIPVRRVVEWSPNEFSTVTTHAEAGRLLADNARYWELVSNEFGVDLNFPGNQDFQLFYLNPAATSGFTSNGIDYSIATQFGRRQTTSGTWTGLPLVQFGNPNNTTLVTANNNDARPQVSQLRLYVNGSNVTRDTLTEIKTGWDTVNPFDATTDQYSLLGTAYQHLDATENFNEIVEKTSNSQIVWNAASPNAEQIGRAPNMLEYLIIDVSNGDHEIAHNAPFTITEIYDAALDTGFNFPDDLHTLTHPRNSSKYPLRVDTTWLPEGIPTYLPGVPATDTTQARDYDLRVDSDGTVTWARNEGSGQVDSINVGTNQGLVINQTAGDVVIGAQAFQAGTAANNFQGTQGMVPAPTAQNQRSFFLRGDGVWAGLGEGANIPRGTFPRSGGTDFVTSALSQESVSVNTGTLVQAFNHGSGSLDTGTNNSLEVRFFSTVGLPTGDNAVRMVPISVTDDGLTGITDGTEYIADGVSALNFGGSVLSVIDNIRPIVYDPATGQVSFGTALTFGSGRSLTGQFEWYTIPAGTEWEESVTITTSITNPLDNDSAIPIDFQVGGNTQVRGNITFTGSAIHSMGTAGSMDDLITVNRGTSGNEFNATFHGNALTASTVTGSVNAPVTGDLTGNVLADDATIILTSGADLASSTLHIPAPNVRGFIEDSSSPGDVIAGNLFNIGDAGTVTSYLGNIAGVAAQATRLETARTITIRY